MLLEKLVSQINRLNSPNLRLRTLKSLSYGRSTGLIEANSAIVIPLLNM